MSFTFQSQSLLRNLTRLLYATAAYADARKTFELYVQIVLKARETAQPERALELKPRSFQDDLPITIVADAITPVMDGAAETQTLRNANEDSDVEFLEALLLGSKLLAMEEADPRDAWRYLVLAGDVTAMASDPIPSSLKAQVEEAKGITRMALASQGESEAEH
jgi:CheY-like chemotaxis protein